MALNVKVVGIDTAAFQSADSYIDPPSGIADTEASGSFEMVIDAFCGGARLCVPLPKDKLGKRPVLFGLWDDWEVVPNVRLTSEGVTEISDKLAKGFLRFANGTAPALATWVAFQFTPSIVAQYVGRTSWELDDVREAAAFTADIMNRPECRRLLTAFDRLRETKTLVTPPEFRPMVGGPFDSDNHLAASYLLSVYMRGWSYGWSLADHPSEPEYRSLWLRNPALRDLAIAAQRDPVPTESSFPWGRLMRRMFDPHTGPLPQKFSLVRQLAAGIRKNRDDIVQSARSLAPGQILTAAFGKNVEGPSRSEEAIIRGLMKAGGSLPYARTGVEDKLLGILRFTASLLGDRAGKIAEQVTADVRRTWIHRRLQNVDADLRLRFRRSTFWDTYEDVGVADVTDTL